MKALRRFTVRAHLPDRLAALDQLSTNLRWSWEKATQDLFARIDPALWASCGNDPVAVLGAVKPARLDELALDEEFLCRLDEQAADLADYLSRPLWYQQHEQAGIAGTSGTTLPSSIAYFSMEFGIAEVLPNYSGGLGILAGDHLKAASDLGLPLIAVGLYYRSGYFRQSLTADGWQQETYPSLDPHGLPLRLLTHASGDPVLVELALPDSAQLRARIWIAQVGRVPLLLLDSDIPENEHELRSVTDRLYGGDQEHRIKQEILAGIGGIRAIRAFTAIQGLPAPEVFHMNEGHAGFLGAERIRELITDSGLDFDTALTVVRSSTVFTTHTPVPAGIDRFLVDMVQRYFGDDEATLLPGVPTDRILALGAEDDPTKFNMAHMGLRLAQRANGVSLLHGRVSRAMFNELWPGFDPDEVPIGSITNGVHARSWAAPQWLQLGRELAGSDSFAEPAVWLRLQQVDAGHLWWIRSQLRSLLVADVRARLRQSWLERGASEAELGWIAKAFDPDVLTIGFARRVPTYKRLTLMLRDPDRLEKLLLDPERPVQLIVAGKSHPADDGGKALIQQVVRFADRPQVRHRIAFLPNYDMSMARLLYWGCDVWLNNPLRPLEACGTSGMKSALNGGLNLSVRDGWWDEWYDGENGWEIPSADGVADPERRDDLESTGLYNLLEQAVAPKFYERDEHGVPPRWMEMVRHTLQTLGPKVLASRMVRDYVEHYYAPAAHSWRKTIGVADDGTEFGGARELAAYRRRAAAAWPRIEITDVDSAGLPDTPLLGSKLTLTAIVQLAGLQPDEVTVQAVLGRVDAGDMLLDPTTVDMSHTDTDGVSHIFSTTTPLPLAGAVGYTVRVLPRHPMLADGNELGLVTLAGG
ncbi:alpha-glucan phosphorylases family protein [Mycobacterium kansasii 732]|uniref:glycogen phosphorylase n=1 Tax=Mycobacterium pseudokansasii TaxID=2341080 RepID=A0A498QSC0_9MYCO|nr:alpha-glucan family phosphorylase [Mycobacterium pseudokansasii]EUA12683.1 alpha-glucan phosphorylases family protein [Mycobacterium kansasii 732]KZS65933.1 glycogen phosphorylase [Mycobacterium kansasii]VAZ98795.1 Glycogen phosphorylase [Mycobacterium pseudokansasii]VBA29999.1 Glycogen phosphorylase [Mycobacterium pseudokansasii]VBA53416.1 Glycogen phosphorylase [Mycobacterium pseudokansasii]